MNLFKLLIATTVFSSLGSIAPALSASEDDISTLLRTKECVDCNLSNAYVTKLSNKDLRDANLKGANLQNTPMVRSDLRNVSFTYTNLKSASFIGSDLRNADFSHADVSGANFCDSDLRGINWTKVIYNNNTKCLPSIAIDYVHPISDDLDSSKHDCHEDTVSIKSKGS